MSFLKIGAKYSNKDKKNYKCINPKCTYKIKTEKQEYKCPLCGFDLLIEK
jgi:DNA-directed RNA polymerase subunit RPC12/RpoP